ncbi:pre-coat protein [Jatropha leaf crumple virus]|uniref:pre-coat protein n=1 Tax=Jatropha leaf crumple virus TaxID=1547577 RepID=UPI00050D5CA6|nr:pre-coat protein [Jatropha leaf crumple virus]AIR77186.1 pre-coat protein [Jatropha leaf crumple virus]AIT11634.1 precoat protein [Jatropha leaf crumple India virus [J. curcas: Jodhpur]]AIT11641.1 precoat protein [Jatropha leaf crumple India virus [J. curcas: Jodhpur]]
MWDPLLNEFPDSVHGLRCMFVVIYVQLVEGTYFPDTLGHELIRDLISVIRAKNYVEATSRYHHFHSRLEGSSPSELGQPIYQPCICPHCPRHKKAGLDQQAQESQAQVVQDLQKPRCP